MSLTFEYESASKSFRTGRLERELQMVQLSAIRCSRIAILWVSLVSFAAISLCVASEQVFIVSVYFIIDLVRKLLDTTSYLTDVLLHVFIFIRQSKIRFHIHTEEKSENVLDVQNIFT
jgi:hypothetical protein